MRLHHPPLRVVTESLGILASRIIRLSHVLTGPSFLLVAVLKAALVLIPAPAGGWATVGEKSTSQFCCALAALIKA